MIAIYLGNVASLYEQAAYERALAVSSKQRREKAEKLKAVKDRARCIGAGLLLDAALGAVLGTALQTKDFFENDFAKTGKKAEGKAEEERRRQRIAVSCLGDLAALPGLAKLGKKREAAGIEEAADTRGKPYLICKGELPAGFSQDLLQLSISHSGDYAAVALSGHRVGIDLQKQRRLSPAAARRLMHEQEKAQYDRLLQEDEAAATAYAISVWTQKEAAGKLLGEGVFTLQKKLADAAFLQQEGIAFYDFSFGAYAGSVAWLRQASGSKSGTPHP